MMCAISVVALLWVGLFSRLIPGHSALTVRDALTAPSGVEQILNKLNTMEQKLNYRIQPMQWPFSIVGIGSSVEPSVVTNILLALEAKVGAVQTKLDATETKLETKLDATETKLETKLNATETKLEATETKLEATETKLEATETKLEAMETKLEATETKLEATETALQAIRAEGKGASTFVRWGRKTCSYNSQLVYSGVAGGSLYDHPGAAANPLCLTLSPQTDGTTANLNLYSYLYGAGYEEIPNHHDYDVPCCVCRAPQTTTITIPGTHDCAAGWTTQYTGHLAAGHPTHKAASQYVCLDGHLENASNKNKNDNGYVLYYTIAQCGSLPCPPYTNGKVVLCVVCSK